MGTLTLTDEHAQLEAGAAGTGWDAWSRPSFRLTLIALGLAAFGLVMVASAASSRAFAPAVLKRLALTALALCAFAFGALVDYRFWRRHQLAVLAVALAGLVVVLLPGVSAAKNGARRWIDVGLPVGFQPSEFAKVCLCIWVAAYCERNLHRMRRATWGFLVPMGLTGAACALILAEPDFGTAVLTGAVCTLVLWTMGTRLVYILAAAAAGLPLVERLVLEVPYRMQRILSFLDPWADPRGAGYQLIQSKIAIGSGGIWGVGLGAGRQEEGFLPAASNDFIFSVIAEELGFIGAVLVICVFLLLIWEGIRVTIRSRDPFGFALALGLTSLLGMQAAAHIAVVTGSVPTKGLSLPFVSAGGSSLIASMLAAGILINIARSEEQPAGHEVRPWQDDVPAYEVVFMNMLRRLGGAVGDHLPHSDMRTLE